MDEIQYRLFSHGYGELLNLSYEDKTKRQPQCALKVGNALLKEIFFWKIRNIYLKCRKLIAMAIFQII